MKAGKLHLLEQLLVGNLCLDMFNTLTCVLQGFDRLADSYIHERLMNRNIIREQVCVAVNQP